MAKELNLKLFLDRNFKETINVYNNTLSGNIETRVPFDYTGYEAKMQIRKKKGHADVLLELSTSDYSIILSTGVIALNKPRADVNSSSLVEGKFYYDVVLIDDNGSYQHLYGEIEVIQNITDVD